MASGRVVMDAESQEYKSVGAKEKCKSRTAGISDAI